MKKIKLFYASKYFNILLFLIYFLIPFVIYFRLFRDDMVPLSGDGVQYFSMKLFFNNSLKAGELPLWNPFLSNGVPFAGDLNGAFYPIAILLSQFSIKWFIYCYYAIHLALGAFFTFLYLKEINCNKVVALCTSFIYLFSIHLGGYRKSHIIIIASVVFLPIVLYYIEKYIKTKEIKYLILSSFAMAITFLGGHVQYSIYTDILVFVYLIYKMILVKFPIKRVLKNIIIWGMIYLGMVAVQLIPTIELIKNYKLAGAGETSYESFSSYSIHPIKIIMMLFPNMFGLEVNQAFGSKYSSEMDIEIFLGVGIFLFIVFAIIYYYKERMVKLSIIFMSCSFIFAACAHIPILNKMLFHIPIIGGFRCPGRVLYIFIFFGYVIFAISISKLIEENNLLKFIKFGMKILLSLCGTLIILILFTYTLSSDVTQEVLRIRYENLKLVFMKPIIAIFFIMVCLKILYSIKQRNESYTKAVYILLNIVILLITIVETSQYSKLSAPTSVSDFGVESSTIQNIKSNINNNKLWLANQNIDGGFRSIIEYNSNVSKEIPAINAFIAFNNPRLFRLFTNQNIMKPFYNFSGLLTGFRDASNNLYMQNDLLSMLGVKYILDPQYLIGDGTIISSIKEEEVVYQNNIIQIPNKNGELYVLDSKISIEPNTYYKISFSTDAYTDIDHEQTFFSVDFYGGEDYDNAEQNSIFEIGIGKNSYETIFNSRNSEISEDIYFRLISNPQSDIEITNLQISKMAIKTEANVYIPVDEENRIFENSKVKDILFAPSSVVNIESVEQIYNNVYDFDLDDISYVENLEGFTTAKTDINDIIWKRNSITAEISAEGDTFVNFSQNYYPGWKVYIDGKRTNLYMVNGLIQGVEVPSGKHTVEFKFIPISIIIGAVISSITFFIGIIIIIKEKRSRKLIEEIYY